MRNRRHIPHVVFGVGAIGVLLLAGIVLILLSGHASEHPGALMILAIGLPAMTALAVFAARRWRSARAGHSHP